MSSCCETALPCRGRRVGTETEGIPWQPWFDVITSYSIHYTKLYDIYGILRDCKSVEEIDIKYLDKIYPQMSSICKENEEIKAECAEITKQLQDGNAEYTKLWKKILEVSVQDIKKNYDYLGANFDLWLGESDSYRYLEQLEKQFNDKGILNESEGAIIVNVSKPEDKKDVITSYSIHYTKLYDHAFSCLIIFLDFTKNKLWNFTLL